MPSESVNVDVPTAGSELAHTIPEGGESARPDTIGPDTAKSRTIPNVPESETVVARPSASGVIEAAYDRSEDDDSVLAFEPHYGLCSQHVRDVLDDILTDMASHTHIHSWERKLGPIAHETLAGVVRGALSSSDLGLNTLLAYSSVDEVTIDHGILRLQPVLHTGDLDAYLFFSNKAPRREGRRFSVATIPVVSKQHPVLQCSRGRIIYINQDLSYLGRAILLMLFTFSLRMQSEDWGFIRAFLERHLSLRHSMKLPYHWQQTSPPSRNPDQQRCYKRVVVTFHINYLIIDSEEHILKKRELFDRTSMCTIPAGSGALGLKPSCLCKASSSVLLTLALPQESESRQEAVELLSEPESLWTVLVVNSHRQVGSENITTEHCTPVAQFVHGIAATLCTQRMNAEAVYDACLDRYRDCDDNSLFDDKHFTKSATFHLLVKLCSELEASISSGLSFMRQYLESDLTRLCSNAHTQETFGATHWLGKLKEEIFALENLHSQVQSLKMQVQESRNALNGFTAVLEARVAVEQGNRMKILAYLATIYLPLTATSSIYSVGVLPKSASFGSFFGVLALFFLLTTLGISLPKIMNKAPTLVRKARIKWSKETISFSAKLWSNMPHPVRNYLMFYYKVIDPECSIGIWRLLCKDWWSTPDSLYLFLLLSPVIVPSWIMLVILRFMPGWILRQLVYEVNLPARQLHMYRYRNNIYQGFHFEPWLVIPNGLRLLLILAWIPLGVALIGLLTLEDALVGVLQLMVSILLCRYVRRRTKSKEGRVGTELSAL